MSRYREISTQISHDKQLIRLTAKYGPLPMLLYMTAIPHADDWGRIKGDAVEFVSEVLPVMLAQVDAVEEALQQIADAGLWQIYTAGASTYIAFPRDAWFKHQNYINSEKRLHDGSKYPAPPGEEWLSWETRPSANRAAKNPDAPAEKAKEPRDESKNAEDMPSQVEKAKKSQEKPRNPATPTPTPSSVPNGTGTASPPMAAEASYSKEAELPGEKDKPKNGGDAVGYFHLIFQNRSGKRADISPRYQKELKLKQEAVGWERYCRGVDGFLLDEWAASKGFAVSVFLAQPIDRWEETADIHDRQNAPPPAAPPGRIYDPNSNPRVQALANAPSPKPLPPNRYAPPPEQKTSAEQKANAA